MPFIEERNAAFTKLEERAAQANMTPAERADYEESLKNCRDYYSTIDSAIERNQRKIISNMYAKGLSITLINECTGLTEDEVIEIIQTLS